VSAYKFSTDRSPLEITSSLQINNTNFETHSKKVEQVFDFQRPKFREHSNLNSLRAPKFESGEQNLKNIKMPKFPSGE
jgi:hypothetical protein